MYFTPSVWSFSLCADRLKHKSWSFITHQDLKVQICCCFSSTPRSVLLPHLNIKYLNYWVWSMNRQHVWWAQLFSVDMLVQTHLCVSKMSASPSTSSDLRDLSGLLLLRCNPSVTVVQTQVLEFFQVFPGLLLVLCVSPDRSILSFRWIFLLLVVGSVCGSSPCISWTLSFEQEKVKDIHTGIKHTCVCGTEP